jgi:hypothetical protein
VLALGACDERAVARRQLPEPAEQACRADGRVSGFRLGEQDHHFVDQILGQWLSESDRSKSRM